MIVMGHKIKTGKKPAFFLAANAVLQNGCSVDADQNALLAIQSGSTLFLKD